MCIRPVQFKYLFLLSPSGDPRIGLVWDNPTTTRDFSVLLLKPSSKWGKLSMMGLQLFSGWYQMILDVFQCSQLFSDVFRLFSDDVFRLLKSSSNWTKSSMMGPQLFLGWYQMILDVFRCPQLFSDVFSWVVTFMDNHPLCGHFFSGSPIDHRYYSQMFSRCAQMFSDVFRCSQMFSDVLRMLSIVHRRSIDILKCVPDVFRCSKMFKYIFRYF